MSPDIGQQILQSTLGMHYVLRGTDAFSWGRMQLEASMVHMEMSAELVVRQYRKFSDNDPGQQSAAATEKEDACPDARRL